METQSHNLRVLLWYLYSCFLPVISEDEFILPNTHRIRRGASTKRNRLSLGTTASPKAGKYTLSEGVLTCQERTLFQTLMDECVNVPIAAYKAGWTSFFSNTNSKSLLHSMFCAEWILECTYNQAISHNCKIISDTKQCFKRAYIK